jgi:hypothetical protein
MNEYPCKDCILKGNCSKYCSEILGSGDFSIFIFIKHNKLCPDCGSSHGYKYDAYFRCMMTCKYCYSTYYPVVTDGKYNISRHKKVSPSTLSWDELRFSTITFDVYYEKWIWRLY